MMEGSKTNDKSSSGKLTVHTAYVSETFSNGVDKNDVKHTN